MRERGQGELKETRLSIFMVVKYICSHKCFQRDTTEVPAGKKGGGRGGSIRLIILFVCIIT